MEAVDIVIIGAGLSGICAAAYLKRRHPEKSVVILERRAQIGGTWDLFRYPGVRSDSDMYTLGYSFRPWSSPDTVASGEHIRDYIETTARELGLFGLIRFESTVSHVSWSSAEQRWTVQYTTAEETMCEIRSTMLVACTGYYDFDEGYVPDIQGLSGFSGDVIHPQHWPDGYTLEGKRVVVVGSGATAVSLVPAISQQAAHVTMLQRSPSYLLSRPAEDWLGSYLSTPYQKLAFWAGRARAIAGQNLLVQLSKRFPEKVREVLLGRVHQAFEGSDVDVQAHFYPHYNPWEQRLCLVSDGDLFESVRQGDVSMVTDHIDRVEEDGIRLRSGEFLASDVIIMATGLKLLFLGHISMSVDGEQIDPSSLLCYRGVMFDGVPNFVSMFGYTSASWTLKIELVSSYLCDLLEFMGDEEFGVVMPHMTRAEREKMSTRSIMDNLSSAGYVKRAKDILPQQGSHQPWCSLDNYVLDMLAFRRPSFREPALKFERRRR